MYRKPWTCVKLLVTYMAFKMFSLLMLYQYLLIIKFSVAVPVYWLRINVTFLHVPGKKIDTYNAVVNIWLFFKAVQLPVICQGFRFF